MKKIEWTKCIKDEIQRQAEQPPCILLGADRDQFVGGVVAVEPEHQVEAEEHFNVFSRQTDDDRWHYLLTCLETLTRSVKENESFQKSVLTMDEAADFLHVSPKRFANIICLERKRQGKTPDFIADNGVMRRVVRDKLFDWVCNARKRTGRRKAV